MPNPPQGLVKAVNGPGFVLPDVVQRIGWVMTAAGPALLTTFPPGFVIPVDLNLVDDEVAIGGPDAAGARRLFQGTEDVASGFNVAQTEPRLVPGAPQTDTLGKAEDSPHVSGDVGTMALAVRQDVPGTLAGADGDYAPQQVDSAGRQRTASVPAEALAVTTSATVLVGAASVALIAASAARRSLTFYNDGPGPLRLHATGAALVTDLRIPNQEHHVVDGLLAQAAWNGISNAATATVTMISATVAT